MTSMFFTAEQDQYVQVVQLRAFYKGLRDGVAMYAYWRDGVQYVGTYGRTLDKVINELNDEEAALLKRYRIEALEY